MRTTEQRVSTLEHVLEEFIIHTDTALNRLEREMEDFKDEMKVFKDEMSDFKDEMKVFKDEMSDFKDEMKDFKDEMSDFKDEMKDFKDEMSDFKDEMKVFKDEMSDFKDEMKVFKDEMSDFKDEMKVFKDEMSDFKDRMENSHKEMNKQWAALAKKMGTLDEDLVSPAVRPIINKYFGCDPIKKSIRELVRKDGESFEVDVLAVCEDKVFMIEVRATPRVNYVDEILEKADLFKKFYPEYEDKEVIPIFASITFPDNIVQYATKKGLYVMAYKEWEYMDIINFDEVSKKQH